MHSLLLLYDTILCYQPKWYIRIYIFSIFTTCIKFQKCCYMLKVSDDMNTVMQLQILYKYTVCVLHIVIWENLLNFRKHNDGVALTSSFALFVHFIQSVYEMLKQQRDNILRRRKYVVTSQATFVKDVRSFSPFFRVGGSIVTNCPFPLFQGPSIENGRQKKKQQKLTISRIENKISHQQNFHLSRTIFNEN